MFFSDEIKINLDGHHELKDYSHDLRKEHKFFSKSVSGDGSVMIWARIARGGKSNVLFQMAE